MAVKQGDTLASNLSNITSEYVIRHLSVQVLSGIFYKSVQLTGYADNKNIMGRKKKELFLKSTNTETEIKSSTAQTSVSKKQRQ
jgi:hypothetical protein